VGVEHYTDLGWMLDDPFGKYGPPLLAASVAIACLGAALEISLALAYMVAQGLGWAWSKNLRPSADARFSVTYTGIVGVGACLAAVGGDPLSITIFAMALTALTLPVAIVPFLFLLNDPDYVQLHGNGVFSNGMVLAIIGLAALIALVTLPLQIASGG
jgi:Mn2+/Fe2+ NRAMP family transporter